MEKKYMVYFVQSPFTKNFQESWICGGALITSTQILTAAACLVETENIYAIAGYNKYLSAKNIDHDECTRTKKQRVIKIVFPTEYKLDYEYPAQRMNVNIGIAIVEKPYNFRDLTYLKHCSYAPQSILVNFEDKYELVNTRAITLGWVTMANRPEITKEHEYQLLQETSTVIVDKRKCTNIFDTPEIVHIIDKYHLCGTNYFQEIEKDTEYRIRSHNDCKIRNYERGSENNNGENNDDCVEDDFGFRKNNNEESKNTNKTSEQTEENYPDVQEYTTKINVYGSRNARRALNQKMCENNLGSPLIKWIDNREVMIGITSSTKINGECNGPVLYVSTAASSKLILCLLETNAAIRQLCNLKSNDGQYDIQEIDINWPKQQESQVLEPMLSFKSEDLDNPENTKEYNEQKESPHFRANDQVHEQIPQKPHNQSYSLVHRIPYRGYAQQRANVPPLLSRPQFELRDSGHRKKIPSISTYKGNQQLGEYEIPPREHYKTIENPQHNLQPGQHYQPQPSSRGSSTNYQQQDKTLENMQYQQPPHQQYNSQQQQYFDSPLKQQNERPYEIHEKLALRDQYGLPNTLQPNRQYEPHLGQRFNQPPPRAYQPAQYKSPEGHTFELSPEILYDQSREHHRKPDAKSKNQPNESYMAQIEALYHKPLASTNGTRQADEESFDQILAQLQEPSSALQPRVNTSRHGNSFENIDHIIQHDSKPDGLYEENKQQHGMSLPSNQQESHLEPPVRSDEIIIRPQIPMNNRNYN